MATIDVTAVIDSIRMHEREGDPGVPSAGFWQLYPKAAGLYIEDDAGAVLGPFLSGDGKAGGQSLSGGTAANDDLTLQGTTHATRTSSYLLLQPNGGNVGIGVASPTYQLQVERNVAGDAGVALFNNTNGADDARSANIWLSSGTLTHTYLRQNGGSTTQSKGSAVDTVLMNTWTGDSTNGNLHLGTYDTVRMTIENGGNVGIGVIDPAANLHVFDPDGNTQLLLDAYSTSYYAYQQFAQGGAAKFEMGIVPTSSDFYINATTGSGAGGSSIYIKKADGNVGIGTVSPNYILDVAVPYARTDTTQRYSAFFGSNDENAFGLLLSHIGAASTSNRIAVIESYEIGSGERMLSLNPSGATVGVGTATPGATFVVSGYSTFSQGSSTAGIATVTLDQADLSEEFFRFNGTVSTGNPIDTAALGSYYGFVRVSVNGTFKKLALYD